MISSALRDADAVFRAMVNRLNAEDAKAEEQSLSNRNRRPKRKSPCAAAASSSNNGLDGTANVNQIPRHGMPTPNYQELNPGQERGQ